MCQSFFPLRFAAHRPEQQLVDALATALALGLSTDVIAAQHGAEVRRLGLDFEQLLNTARARQLAQERVQAGETDHNIALHLTGLLYMTWDEAMDLINRVRVRLVGRKLLHGANFMGNSQDAQLSF
jgi:hypothetical protein